MKEHGICAKCKKSVGCPYADDRITGCKNFVLEPELKLTNKEWLRNADTEQLAEWIAHQTMIALLENQNNHSLRMTYPAYWVEWLKQPHTPQKQDDYPCNVKGCSLETRQACCGCPDYFEWEKQHKE